MKVGLQKVLGMVEYVKVHAEDINRDPGRCAAIAYMVGVDSVIDDPSKTLLAAMGFSDAWIINWLDSTPQQFCRTVLCESPTVIQILLWKALYSINDAGDCVGYDQTLLEIKDKFGEDSIEYKNASDTVEWLRDYKEDKA